MAILFSKTPSHQYLRTTDTPCLQWGEGDESKSFTISLWFKAANVTEDHTLLVLEHNTASDHRYYVKALGTNTNDIVKITAQVGGTTGGASKGPFLANTWHHVMACAYIDGTGIVDLLLYLDGAAGTLKQEISAPTTDETFIQVGGHSASLPTITGQIAEVAVYDTELHPVTWPGASDMLVKGVRPIHVLPQHLIYYAPLDGRYQDLRGGHTLTPYNSPVNADDHPRMI